MSMTDKPELATVLYGNAYFTKNLYNILSGDSGNVFFSPVSIHTVLSIVYQAAKGPTKDAIASALNIPNPNVAAKGYNVVMTLLNKTPGVQLHIANKVYLKTGYNLLKSFKDIVQNEFQSEVELVDFEQSVKAAGNINDWVELKTNNKIKDLIEPDSLDKDTRAVLVNAIYFKGNWLNKFDPSRTQTENFYLNETDTVECQMMFRKGKYMFKEDKELDAKLLEIPYSNRNLSLIVILPNKRNGISDLEAKLTEVDLTTITDGMYMPDVNVKLPKFKIETTLDLKDALTKLGLGIIFDENAADFSGMIDSKEILYVSEVVQKAFIEVNEEGAEASAATGMLIKRKCCRRKELQFQADHPFIIQLKVSHNENSIILFEGRLNKPACN